jgi:phosphoadenosine phosphosulfate reductase
MLTEELKEKIENVSLENSLRLVSDLYPGQVVFSSSLGQEDQVITDALFRNNIPVTIFTIDTGRLFNETYELLEKTNARYHQSIKVYFPDADQVEKFVLTKGINGFYESAENRKECCHIRKVKPLNRALAGAKVWITGLRSEQSANRKDMPVIERDGIRQLYKFNPLINWSYDEVLNYLKKFDVPYNPLHDRGFISIGCAPCTRAVKPGEDARAGRWWWENSHKECGLHSMVLKQV